MISPPRSSASTESTAAATARPRSILRAEIVETRGQDSLVCAGPGDFTLGQLEPIGEDAVPALPYCLDFGGRRSMYLEGLDPAAAQAAPFYYLYARRHATHAVLVPWERQSPPFDAPQEPVLMFSSGRCGSTLLTGILAEAGVPSVSEPDFYTQYTAGCLFGGQPEFYRGPARRAVDAVMHDLAAALTPGGTVLVKLRAEVCYAVRPLLALAARRPKTLFMIRDIEPWARSSLRIFDFEPDQALSKYVLGLKCLAVQRELSDCHVLRYETLLRRPDETCAALAAFLGRTIAPEAVARAMAHDAQSGTPLARGTHPARAEHDAKLAEILRLWDSPKYADLRALAESL